MSFVRNAAKRRLAGLCLAVLAATTLAAGSAEAVTRLPWQKYVVSACEGDESTCEINIVTVPANRRIEITNVACFVRVIDGGNINQALIRKTPDFFFDIFVPTLVDNENGNMFAYNTETLLYALPGNSLLAQIVATADVLGFQCKVAGELIAP